MTHESFFSPFIVALIIPFAFLIYFKVTFFNLKRLIVFILLFILASGVFFLQQDYGIKKIGNWFENKDEYTTNYYSNMYSLNNKLLYEKVKTEIRRPPTKDYFVSGDPLTFVFYRESFITKIFMPDGQTIDYGSEGLNDLADFGSTTKIPLPNGLNLELTTEQAP